LRPTLGELKKKPTLHLVLSTPAPVPTRSDPFERSAFLAVRIADLHYRIQVACEGARLFLLRRA
jgi:hypothetical protein